MIWEILYGSLAALVLTICSGCGPTEPPATPGDTVDCEVSLVFERPFDINYPGPWTSSGCAQSYIQTAASPLCDLEGNFITACDPSQGSFCPSNEHVIEFQVVGVNGYYAVVNVTNASPQGGPANCPVIVQVPTDQDSEITATWFDLCCPNLGNGRRITWATDAQTVSAFIPQQLAQSNNAFANVFLRYTGIQNYPCF